MIRCESITFHRGERAIFKDISLNIEAAIPTMLKGPNGSGKTTLLRLLSGLLTPYSGKITWNGENIFSDIYSYRSLLQFIGHKNAINRDLTVYENIAFFAKLGGNNELIWPAVSFMELETMADFPCKILSQGWQRRVALSRLMLLNRDIWLLDEPFANLDKTTSDMVKGLIESKCNAGGIVVFSSHKEIEFADYREIDLSNKVN